jgi:RimJ/RimL family protein N-acetyltransferase
VNVPRVETKRLVLRGWRAEDIAEHAALCADPEVMRFLGGTVDRPQAWRQMATHAGHWELRGYGNWVVERAEDGRFLGRAGLWYPDGWVGLEVGWKLARHAWGQGYATEAARASIDWAWGELDITRLVSVIHPDNEASVRVAHRLGMERAGTTEIGGQIVDVYAVERGRAHVSPPL